MNKNFIEAVIKNSGWYEEICKILENLTELNRIFLTACYGKSIDLENFKDALTSIPEILANVAVPD